MRFRFQLRFSVLVALQLASVVVGWDHLAPGELAGAVADADSVLVACTYPRSLSSRTKQNVYFWVFC